MIRGIIDGYQRMVIIGILQYHLENKLKIIFLTLEEIGLWTMGFIGRLTHYYHII